MDVCILIIVDTHVAHDKRILRSEVKVKDDCEVVLACCNL